MKGLWVGLVAFCLFACRAAQTSIPTREQPPVLDTATALAPTSTVDLIRFPPPTATVFLTATATSILPTLSATPTESAIINVSRSTPTLQTNLHLTAGQSLTITAIQMFDSRSGWGFDNEQHILRTEDGGNAWQDVTPPMGNFQPSGFFALDVNTAWATFNQGLYSEPKSAFVWHTTDGGQSWQAGQKFSLETDREGNTNPSDYYLPINMQFIDAQAGWLLVDVYSGMNSTRPLLFQTNDSGATWELINDHYHDLNAPVAIGFVFIDKQTGWFGQNAIPLKFGMYNIDSIIVERGWHTLKTTDGGHSFTETTLLPLTEDIKSPGFAGKPADCGETRMLRIAPQVVGIQWSCQIYWNSTVTVTIHSLALTADDGKTWSVFPAYGSEFFIDAQNGWRLTPDKQLQQTDNGGLGWAVRKIVSWDSAQFDFISEQEGWATVTGNKTSALLHTIDGGWTWAEIKPVIAP